MLCRGWRQVAPVALGLTLARTSAAEPPADESARLAILLRTGADATKAKDWTGCVDALWDALALEDSARIAGDLGLCEEQAGRFGDAMNHAHRALAAATPAMLPKEPWKSYQASAVRLRSQVALVGILVTPSDARIVVDGRPYGKADGSHIAMSYGKHTVVARAEGYEDASDTRLVTPGGVPVIQLSLKSKLQPSPQAAPASTAPQAPAPVPIPAPSPAPAPTGPRTEAEPSPQAPFPCLPARSVRGVLVPLACVTTAAFAASAATTIGFEVHAASMRSALAERGFEQNGCAPGHAAAGSPECREILSRVQQRTDAANVMIGTGIAAAVLVAGVGLSIALEPKRPAVTAMASATGGGVIVHGEW